MVRGSVLTKVLIGGNLVDTFKVLKDQWVKEDSGWKHVPIKMN